MLISNFNLQLVVQTPSGNREDRLSPWATYVVEPPKEEGTIYRHKFWNPPENEVNNHTNTLLFDNQPSYHYPTEIRV